MHGCVAGTRQIEFVQRVPEVVQERGVDLRQQVFLERKSSQTGEPVEDVVRKL